MTEVLPRPGLPALVAADPAVPPDRWLTVHRDPLRDAVFRHGAVLVRGLALADAAAAAAAGRALTDRLVGGREEFAPRTVYEQGVFGSTVWPTDQPMCMHHELSYAVEMPSLLILCCLTAPAAGGRTPLADAATVLRDLPPELVDRFTDGWILLRTYNDVVGMSWRNALGTDSVAEAEDYLREQGVAFQWGPAGELHTRRRRPALVRHPVTGDVLWCNQVAFLNEWTMEPAVRTYLLAEFGPHALPFTTLDGSGAPLDEETVQLVNDVYDAHTVAEPWRDGDLLIVDNLRMAHARESYEGDRREIVVMMADPVAPQGATGRS